MVKHIVMFKVNGAGAVKAENASKVKTALETCLNVVPGMLKYEVGIDIGVDATPWDVALYSEFADRAALDAYQRHPTHVAAKTVIAQVRETRAAVDFEV